LTLKILKKLRTASLNSEFNGSYKNCINMASTELEIGSEKVETNRYSIKEK